MILLAALAAAALAAEPAHEHKAPAASLAEPAPAPSRGVNSERQHILSEMWQRRIISADSPNWTQEDIDLLLRLQQAEARGAVEALKRRVRGLQGLAVPYKPAGKTYSLLRLTREGYDRWQFLRSQDAIELFESKGVETGLVFLLSDAQDRKLFDSNGRLTPAGDDVYQRALAGIETHWKTPNGQLFGNRPPKPAAAPVAPAPEPPRASAPSRSAPGAPQVTGGAVEKEAPPAAPPTQQTPQLQNQGQEPLP